MTELGRDQNNPKDIFERANNAALVAAEDATVSQASLAQEEEGPRAN